MTEARLIIATLAQSFRPRLVPERPVEPRPAITLAPGSRVLLEG